MAFRDPSDYRPKSLDQYQRAIHSRDPSELARLGLSLDRFVRARVASNRHTPQSTLEKLARDADPGVYGAVACNRQTTQPILSALEKRGDWRISEKWLARYGLMSNPLTSKGVITELYREHDLNLKLGRINRLDCPNSVLRDYAKLPYEKSPKSATDTVLQIMRRKARIRLGLPITNGEEESEN